MRQDFSDAALILLGHGTTKNENSAAPVYQHAAELRRRNLFADVREAFWKQEPRVQAVLSDLTAPRVFIVPLFVSEAYFSDQIIPQELGFRKADQIEWRRTIQRGQQTLVYCRPIGVHKLLTQVLLARACEVVEQFPGTTRTTLGEITLFVVGHGTEKNVNSRRAIERQVEWLRELNLYAAVTAVFLEEEPKIQRCCELAKTKDLVIVPFFISDGLHTQQDIPVLLGEAQSVVEQRIQSGQLTWHNPTERQGKRIWYAPSVGSDPRIAEVILEQVWEQD